MFNKFRDKYEVEQNPLALVNLEDCWKKGEIPSSGSDCTYNGLTPGEVDRRAADDIFGCLRQSGSYREDIINPAASAAPTSYE